jgi:hypothetical protein
MKAMISAAMLMAAAATAGAQTVGVHEAQAKAAFEKQLQIGIEKTPASGIHVSVESRAVTGAPYSAEAVTEFAQALADGNRIVRRSSAHVYRDAAGRTRRETLGADGQVKSITITDPAAGTSYVLDPNTSTARRSVVVTSFAWAGGAHLEGSTGEGKAVLSISPKLQHETQAQVAAKIQQETEATLAAKLQQVAEAKAAAELTAQSHLSAGRTAVTTVGPVTWIGEGTWSATDASTEDLGQQIIEGVSAKGSRTTTVTPAGAIGNELPIKVVAEEWFSPDLKVLVMTKHVDPRAGETTYRLTGINRGAPSASLFEVPAGYTVK